VQKVGLSLICLAGIQLRNAERLRWRWVTNDRIILWRRLCVQCLTGRYLDSWCNRVYLLFCTLDTIGSVSVTCSFHLDSTCFFFSSVVQRSYLDTWPSVLRTAFSRHSVACRMFASPECFYVAYGIRSASGLLLVYFCALLVEPLFCRLFSCVADGVCRYFPLV
jgi:hypothetical protein